MKSATFQKFAVFFLIFLIFLIATSFHFQIHFEDVLKQVPATEYGVNISIWRIMFEPVIGPLLFLNRSLYALEELPLALLWIVIFYGIYSLAGIFKVQHNRKKNSLEKLSNIPLIFGICFAFFVLVLFIPLPNNTIVNNAQDTVLVTTHAHTEFSHDGLTSQKNMWVWHKRNGFDAFFITDHANHKKSLQFAQEQISGEFSSYPLVMVGQEHSGTNHMSLLGLNGKFETKGMADKAVIDSVHRYGGAVIINHWFDGKGKEKEFYEELGADGFEIENAGKGLYYDRAVFDGLKKFCEDKGLTMVGGLDFHGYGRVCSLYNAFKIPDWEKMDHSSKENAIIKILKNGPQEKLQILMYKDRPFYPQSNLLLRPFFTAVNYFRTLNLIQVFSWAFWLLLFQFSWKYLKRISVPRSTGIVILATTSAIFMIVLALRYYFRGEAVKGYSEVYSEYSIILGPIGLALLLYALVIGYLRGFKNRPKAISK